jgi:hypothetical protein
MPRAYLRIDPNLDQHPDAHLLLDLICAGARQLPRGRFRTWEHAIKALGKAKATRAKERNHVKEQPDGSWLIDGWDIWQEGDYTVGERVRRYREKRYGAVTSTVTESLPPSEARGERREEQIHPPPLPPAREGEPGEAERLQTEAPRGPRGRSPRQRSAAGTCSWLGPAASTAAPRS